jgi:hypothetical protein
MIYVPLDGNAPPEEWVKKAEAVTQQLNNASTTQERYEIIDKNSPLWGELKSWLLEKSHNKCWYTEARNDSAHFEVEHFRPKKWKAKSGATDFEGYWWLAFEWTNYRICGSAPNRKKGDFFPLHSDSIRASSEKRYLVEDENFTLIDPVDPSDPLLLSFDESGSCIPERGCIGWDKERAEVSIGLYALNGLPQLTEGRQRVWQECWILLNELVELRTENAENPSVSKRTSIKEKTKQLRAKIRADQPFSAVARSCLSVSGYPFAQSIAASA